VISDWWLVIKHP